VVGDDGIEARLSGLYRAGAKAERLLGNRVERPRLEVPAAELARYSAYFLLFRQGRPLLLAEM